MILSLRAVFSRRTFWSLDDSLLVILLERRRDAISSLAVSRSFVDG